MPHSLRPVADHLAHCLSLVGRPAARPVRLEEALGLVLAENVVSEVSLPGFDNAAMDGFAVYAADLAGADTTPVSLPVAADIPAGSHHPHPVGPGRAARIMTGAPLPDGPDTVVQVEWTNGWTDPVVFHRAPAAGINIRRAGEDVTAGDLVLSAGAVLTPRAVGLAAAVGRAEVRVFPAPRVLVLATGDELVEPGTPLQPGQLYESNGRMLAAAVRAAGARPVNPGIVADDEQTLTHTLAEHLPGVDLVVTTGGVSAGAYDTVKAVLAATGTVEFFRVAMQPGMPQGCGTLTAPDGRTVPVITLPGNPVSSFVSFEVFVRPVLRAMTGHVGTPPLVPARTLTGWRSPVGKDQFVRVRMGGTAGDRTIEPVGAQRSHLVADLAHANALAIVPAPVEQVHAGQFLDCMPLEVLP